MPVLKFNGELELDPDRGVLYFHQAGDGRTLFRMCQLPTPIPDPSSLEVMLDITLGGKLSPETLINWTRRGDIPPAFTSEIREAVLSALRRALNPTAHTDACFELRAMGVRKCSRVCQGIRGAIELLSGDAPPNPDWPYDEPGCDPPVLDLRLGHSENFSEGGQNGTPR